MFEDSSANDVAIVLLAAPQVPAVQRNIIRHNPAAGGAATTSTSSYHAEHRVLTQLGAIRRQLQLEQMNLAADDDDHRV